MNWLTKGAIIILLVMPVAALATMPPITQQMLDSFDVTSAFHEYVTVTPSISVPTVVEVPLTLQPGTLPILAVDDLTTNQFQPYLLKEQVTTQSTKSQVQALGASGSASAITDSDYGTYLEFPVGEGVSNAGLTFTFVKPISASSLSFALDANVALPQTVSITAVTTNGPYTVLAPTRLYDQSISFPKTTAAVWHVSFDYVQPLRITEMQFNEAAPGVSISRVARFLAQPGDRYQLYFNADRYIQQTTKEAGDLYSDKGVVRIASTGTVSNPSYKAADSDADQIPDLVDNCVSVANPDQLDSDRNGRGDACEDYDRDGVINSKDNCANTPNQEQIDTDADGIGDTCDTLDNRVTERLPWLPWVGIGIAGIVLVGLFVFALRYKKEDIPKFPNPASKL